MSPGKSAMLRYGVFAAVIIHLANCVIALLSLGGCLSAQDSQDHTYAIM
jgi:hypothetical protein